MPADSPLSLGPVGTSPRFRSQPLSELNPLDVASPVVRHTAADNLPSSGRPNFKVNLPQPPRFGTISVNSDITSWLYKVGKVCRLSGYPKSDWSIFASTLLENTPQTLFDTAETKARKTSPQALENFLDWDRFTKWCELNLNLANHTSQAEIAISNLKQVSTVSVYRATFDSLAARAGNEGMHIFWWYQGLKPVIATATALDPRTNAEYTDLADAQNAAVAVENISMPGPFATSNLDSNRTFREHKKGKFVHPTQPAVAEHFKPGTRHAAANKWTRGTAPSTQQGPPGYKPSGFRPITLADQNPALLAYMTSHGNSPAPITPALAKPAKSRRPGTCWVKGCFGTGHTKWQDCPKTAAYFTKHNGPGPMDTTVSKHSSSAHASHKRSASAAAPIAITDA